MSRKNSTILLWLLAVAGVGGIVFFFWRKQSQADLETATGTTHASALAGTTPPKSLLDTLAGLLASNPASNGAAPAASSPVLTTTASPDSSASIVDTYTQLIQRRGQPKPAYTR